MDALVAGEIARIRMRERHEEAARWRRLAARHTEARRRIPARRRVPARSPVGEFDRWYLWRFVEPDLEYYGRGG